MRRWDRLLDLYIESTARGESVRSPVAYTEARLIRWGRVAQGASPRVGIEHIDSEMITRYIANCSSFRAQATVYATLSTMRGFGDYLVRQGLWKINPLRWMKGPKVTPYSRLPKRIDHAHMEAMWREAANRHGAYTSHLWIRCWRCCTAPVSPRRVGAAEPRCVRSHGRHLAHRWPQDGMRALRAVRRWCCGVWKGICRFATTNWKKLDYVARPPCW